MFARLRQPGDSVIVRIRTTERGHWVPATVKAVHADRSVTICSSAATRKKGYPDHFMPRDVRPNTGPAPSSARRR